MRIIGGTHRGRVIKTPKDLLLRPTTDFAKEALFNILQNQIDFENVRVLDLFAGTGHISFEFASRCSSQVVSVDKNFKCIKFIRETADALGLKIDTIKDNVFDFLNKPSGTYDVIFADPPYDLKNIEDIHSSIFKQQLLKPGGLLIIEHGERTRLDKLSYFVQQRRYGGVNFSFFNTGVNK